VAASCLGECLGGVGEAVAGGDRNLKLPVLYRGLIGVLDPKRDNIAAPLLGGRALV
jgi:hypothetical protein